jgi:hypothetical protein
MPYRISQYQISSRGKKPCAQYWLYWDEVPLFCDENTSDTTEVAKKVTDLSADS